MKTTICKMAAVLAASIIGYAANASDSYLYWMLGEEITCQGSALSYDYAKVKLDDTYLNLYEGATAQGTEIGSALAGTPFYWGLIESGKTYNTFLFELYADSSSDPVGTLSQSFASMTSFIGNSSTVHSAYTLTSVVPEPTSGLLMLIGMAGLALRRKRA